MVVSHASRRSCRRWACQTCADAAKGVYELLQALLARSSAGPGDFLPIPAVMQIYPGEACEPGPGNWRWPSMEPDRSSARACILSRPHRGQERALEFCPGVIPMVDAPLPTTCVTLLARLRQHPTDQAAWVVFVECYGRHIHRWCRQWRLQDAD